MSPRPPARSSWSKAVKVTGEEACRALLTRRPRDIRRIYLMPERLTDFADIVAWASAHKVPLDPAPRDALARLADTMHHDGILFVAERPRPASLAKVLEGLSASEPLSLVLADGIKNPNNLGAIARVCAYFGVPHLLTCGDSAGYSDAALRTSQGAAELVTLAPLDDATRAIAQLKQRGIAVVATSPHARETLARVKLPARSLMLVGSENAGLSPAIERLADHVVAIPGSGALESLNVAVALSIVLWEHWRSWRLGDSRPSPPPMAAKQRRPRCE
ncbi:MAG: RNA methyltransferase [Myxococcota bacterium]